MGPVSADGLRERVRDFLAGHDPARLPRIEFLQARFDAGLAAVHYPEGLGGLGLPRALQAVVEAEFTAAGAPAAANPASTTAWRVLDRPRPPSPSG